MTHSKADVHSKTDIRAHRGRVTLRGRRACPPVRANASVAIFPILTRSL